MVNDINAVIASLAKIDNASAMIMESTRKEKNAYAEEIKKKTQEFDEQLSADIEKKAAQLRDSLLAENQQMIDNCRTESDAEIKKLDAAYTQKKDEWVNSIFETIIKE